MYNYVVIIIVYAKCVNRGITKKSNWCCLHQVVNSGTQNCANNKNFELKLNTKFILNLFAI